MAGVVMTACIDATGNLQLQLSEIALAFGICETRRDLLRDGARAGVGEAAIIQPRARDDVADEIEIGRSHSGRIERFPDRIKIPLGHQRKNANLRMRRATFSESESGSASCSERVCQDV